MLAAVQAFRRGEASAENFLDLCDTRDITVIAHNMQGRHVEGLAAVLDASHIALSNIRDRRQETGKFGVTGDELATLALLVDTYTNFWLAQSGDLYGRARSELYRLRHKDKVREGAHE
ncbi:MAG: hypothetical protein GY848_15050 [Methyloversatilis sp.]|nr:hypothetical protein [Methyloversatilis sp.]